MNLILHQVFKDLRLTRILLGAFWAILGLDLAISQEWIGAPVWEWPYPDVNNRLLWQHITPLLSLMFGGVMTLTVVVTDTPARENGFLRTRPMPVSAIWFGKLIFVTVFVIVPALLELSLHLYLSKVSGPDFGGILLERISLIVPLALLIAGIGAGTVNKTGAQSNLVAMTIAFLLGMGGLGIASAMHLVAPGSFAVFDPEPSRLRLSVAMAIAGAGLLAAAVSFIHRQPSIQRQTGITVAIGLTAILSFLFVPKNVPLSPAAQAEIDRVVAGKEFTIPHGAISLSGSRSDNGRPTGKRTISVRLDAPDLPPDWTLEAPATPIRIGAAGGLVTSVIRPDRNRIFESQANPTFGDVRSIHASLPEATLLSFTSLHAGTERAFSVTGGEITLPETASLWEEPTELSLTPKTRVHRWEVAARMPLARPGIHTDDDGTWQLIKSRYETNGHIWHVVLKRTQVWREFSGDQDRRDFDRWPGNRFQFLFFDPQSKTVHHYQAYPQVRRSAGRHNGVGSAYVLLASVRPNDRQSFQPTDPSRLELLIMKKSYLGDFESAISRQVRLDDLRQHGNGGEQSHGEKLPREDMMRRFRSLERPGTDTSRATVAAYVADVLELITASRTYPESHDEITTALAAFVPTQTGLFLDGLEATSGPARRALEDSLNMGLTSAHRETLIARLRRDPAVCRFLMNRGWLESAREEILALADHDRHLDIEALRALLTFADDPRVLPRFIEEIGFHHRVDAYELLARQPGMPATLDAIVHRMWKYHAPLAQSIGQVDDVLKIAALHGVPEAHAEMLDLFRKLKPEERRRHYFLHFSLRDCTELPGLNFRDRIYPDRIAKAIEPLVDRTFRYDPSRRLFTTRPLPTPSAKDPR